MVSQRTTVYICSHIEQIVVSGEVDNVVVAVWWLAHSRKAWVPQSGVNHNTGLGYY